MYSLNGMGCQNGAEILANYDQKLFYAKTIILSHSHNWIIFHDQIITDVRHCDGRVSVTTACSPPHKNSEAAYNLCPRLPTFIILLSGRFQSPLVVVCERAIDTISRTDMCVRRGTSHALTLSISAL